jgi:hypothetical protein
LFSREGFFIPYLHPEIYYIHENFINTYVVPFTSALYFTTQLGSYTEGYLSPVLLILNIILLVFSTFIFIAFFFSWYNNSSTDENTIDQDFLIASMTVESEEEVASIDDISVVLVLLVFLFAWYFYANCIFILTNIPEISVIYYNLPFLYYMIILLPIFLLYDFGIFFVTYLRGASSTSSFAMELLYDYIAVTAFFIRLGVQNVRLLLMTFTYFSLYECIISFMTLTSSINNYEDM